MDFSVAVPGGTDTRFADVIRSDTLTGFIQFLKQLLLFRLPYHAGSKNSVTIQYIQSVIVDLDELIIHIGNKDFPAFLTAFSDVVASERNIRRCFFKMASDGDEDMKKLRNMALQLWRLSVSKVSAMLKAVPTYDGVAKSKWDVVFAAAARACQVELENS